MWTLSDKLIWIPLYILFAYFVFRRLGWKNGLVCMVFIALMVTIVDQTCGSIIRHAVERLRPSSPDNPISALIHTVNGYHGGRYSFPSNTLALALFLSKLFANRRATIALFAWSAAVYYSRIYLGVHYHGDVIGGFIVGAIVTLLCFKLMSMIFSMPRLALSVNPD